MKNLIIGFCFFLFCYNNSFSQKKAIDVDLIFKLHLFLDYENTHYEALRNDSLLFALLNDCEIVLEKVEIEHDRFVAFPPDFEVYRMLEYSFRKKVNYYSALNIHESDSYMIAINNDTGRSYRLRGFNSIDFNIFFTDYLETLYFDNSKITKREIKKLKEMIIIDGLDIDCLFRSINQVGRNVTKFPCLRNRNDPVFIR
jgi:hypothetical protein